MSAAAEPVRELVRRLARIRSSSRFAGVEEIGAGVRRVAERRSGIASADTIGITRAGRSLARLTIGSGDRQAVVLGMTHPNEPTGAHGALALAELLAADDELRSALGLMWHIVPCADPDGAALNEAWFGGPYDRATYARQFYRPPFAEQVEWTFHMEDRRLPGLTPLPETKALMGLIDAVEPELMVSMHNAEVGGLYCYVTRDRPDLTHAMAAICDATGLRAYRGEPEEPADILAPGVFRVAPALEGAAMLCSTDYAGRHDAFAVMTEPPLWADPRVGDLRPIAFTRAESYARYARRSADLAAEHAGWVGALEGRWILQTPRHRSVAKYADDCAAAGAHADTDSAGDGPCSVAYASSLAGLLHLERLRAAGHLAGALRAELAAGNDDNAITVVLAEVERRIDEWGAEADDVAAPFVGLDGAVRAHVGLALASAAALADG